MTRPAHHPFGADPAGAGRIRAVYLWSGLIAYAAVLTQSFGGLRSWALGVGPLSDWHSWLVPITLDVTAANFALAVVVSRKQGRLAPGICMPMVYGLTGVSAYLNSIEGGQFNTGTAVYLGFMSVVAIGMFHAMLHDLTPPDSVLAGQLHPRFGRRWLTAFPSTLTAAVRWVNYPPYVLDAQGERVPGEDGEWLLRRPTASNAIDWSGEVADRLAKRRTRAAALRSTEGDRVAAEAATIRANLTAPSQPAGTETRDVETETSQPSHRPAGRPSQSPIPPKSEIGEIETPAGTETDTGQTGNQAAVVKALVTAGVPRATAYRRVFKPKPEDWATAAAAGLTADLEALSGQPAPQPATGEEDAA